MGRVDYFYRPADMQMLGIMWVELITSIRPVDMQMLGIMWVELITSIDLLICRC